MHTINTHRKNLIPYKLLEIYVALRNQNPVLRYLEYFKYDGNEAHLLATNYQICFRLRVSKEQIAHHISVSLVVHWVIHSVHQCTAVVHDGMYHNWLWRGYNTWRDCMDKGEVVSVYSSIMAEHKCSSLTLESIVFAWTKGLINDLVTEYLTGKGEKWPCIFSSWNYYFSSIA